MLQRIYLINITCMILLSVNAFCQISGYAENDPILTGNLNKDLLMYTCYENRSLDSTEIKAIYSDCTGTRKKYSPLRAALYSALIPGAGQFYTKSYWKAAGFLGAEVISWVIYAIYETKGDKKTDEFQKFADEHWSVVRYAHWIRSNYARYYNSAVIPSEPIDDNISQPWNYVVWEIINEIEKTIGDSVNKSGFSHQLAPYGHQQYYEMIGKYPQFGGGWDDAVYFTANDVKTGNVSENFLKYSRMRSDANSFYNIAATAAGVILANHLLSALEAAWNASRINKKIQMQGHILPRTIYGNIVEYVPTLKVKLVL